MERSGAMPLQGLGPEIAPIPTFAGICIVTFFDVPAKVGTLRTLDRHQDRHFARAQGRSSPLHGGRSSRTTGKTPPDRRAGGRTRTMDDQLAAPWLMLECGLSHDRPKSGIWISKARVRLVAIGQRGAPFGRARAIWMYLATKARANLSGSTVEISLSEMTDVFGGKPRTNKEHLRRLADCHFQRLDPEKPTRTRRQRLLEIINARGSSFTISLYADFVNSARQAIQCPTGLVASFVRANKLASLDLYLWYQWRVHREDFTSVDAFGPQGPYALLPISDNVDKRRDDFHKRHDLVTEFWPDCPFDYDGAQIIHSSERPKRTRPVGRAAVPAKRRPTPSEKKRAKLAKLAAMAAELRERQGQSSLLTTEPGVQIAPPADTAQTTAAKRTAKRPAEPTRSKVATRGKKSPNTRRSMKMAAPPKRASRPRQQPRKMVRVPRQPATSRSSSLGSSRVRDSYRDDSPLPPLEPLPPLPPISPPVDVQQALADMRAELEARRAARRRRDEEFEQRRRRIAPKGPKRQ